MEKLTFGYNFLSAYSLGVYVVIYFFGIFLLLAGRKIFEGKAYNVARSGDLGDAGLTGFIVLAAWIIRQPDFHMANWMETTTFHQIIIGFSVLSAIIYARFTMPKHTMDRLHAWIIWPIFVYFIVITMPVYIYSGNPMLVVAGLFCLSVWLFFYNFDRKRGRLNQREWIKKNHPDWKFKN